METAPLAAAISQPATAARPRIRLTQSASAETDVLSQDAPDFVALLRRTFEPRRRDLLPRREEVQLRLLQGELTPDFIAETRELRQAPWTVAPVPPELADRRVEIISPVDRKMIINALNSRAQVYLADFEDSLSPTCTNCIRGLAPCRKTMFWWTASRSPQRRSTSASSFFTMPRP